MYHIAILPLKFITYMAEIRAGSMLLDRHSSVYLDRMTGYRDATTVAAVRHTSVGVMDNKKPLQLQGLRYYSRRVKPAVVINTYGSSPDASIRASSIAPGEHMMLMKVAPVSLATIGRCGQLMAMRKRANSA